MLSSDAMKEIFGLEKPHLATLLIPRPMRDSVVSLPMAYKMVRTMNTHPSGSAQAAVMEVGFSAIPLRALSKVFVTSLARTALATAALGAIVLSPNAWIAAIISGAVSLPATMVAGGALLAGTGASHLLEAVSQSSFSALGIALLAGLGALALTEFHDVVPFGVGEKILEGPIDACSNRVQAAIARAGLEAADRAD